MKSVHNIIIILMLFCACSVSGEGGTCMRRKRVVGPALTTEQVALAAGEEWDRLNGVYDEDGFAGQLKLDDTHIKERNDYMKKAVDYHLERTGLGAMTPGQLQNGLQDGSVHIDDFKQVSKDKYDQELSNINDQIKNLQAEREKARSFLRKRSYYGNTPEMQLESMKKLASSTMYDESTDNFLAGKLGDKLKEALDKNQDQIVRINALEAQINTEQEKLNDADDKIRRLNDEKTHIRMKIDKSKADKETIIDEIGLNHIPVPVNSKDESASKIGLDYNVELSIAQQDASAATQKKRILARQIIALKKKKSYSKSVTSEPPKPEDSERLKEEARRQAASEVEEAKKAVDDLGTIPAAEMEARPSTAELQDAQRMVNAYNDPIFIDRQKTKKTAEKNRQIEQIQKDIKDKSDPTSRVHAQHLRQTAYELRLKTQELQVAEERLQGLQNPDLEQGYYNPDRQNILDNADSTEYGMDKPPTKYELTKVIEEKQEIYGTTSDPEERGRLLADINELKTDKSKNIDQRRTRQNIQNVMKFEPIGKKTTDIFHNAQKDIKDVEFTRGMDIDTAKKTAKSDVDEAKTKFDSAKGEFDKSRAEIPVNVQKVRDLEKKLDDQNNRNVENEVILDNINSRAELKRITDERNGERFMKRHGITGEKQKEVVRTFLELDNKLKAAKNALAKCQSSCQQFNTVIDNLKDRINKMDFETKLGEAAYADARQRAADGVVKRGKMTDVKYAQAIMKQRGLNMKDEIYKQMRENEKVLKEEEKVLKDKRSELKGNIKKLRRMQRIEYMGGDVDDLEFSILATEKEKLDASIDLLTKKVKIRKQQAKVFTDNFGISTGHRVDNFLLGAISRARNIPSHAANVLFGAANNLIGVFNKRYSEKRYFPLKDIPSNDIQNKLASEVIQIEEARQRFELKQAKEDYEQRKAQIESDRQTGSTETNARKIFENQLKHKRATEYNLGRESVNLRHFKEKMKQAAEFKLKGEIRAQVQRDLEKQIAKKQKDSLMARLPFAAARKKKSDEQAGFLDVVQREVRGDSVDDLNTVADLKLLMERPPNNEYDGSEDIEFLDDGPNNDRLREMQRKKKSEKEAANDASKRAEVGERLRKSQENLERMGRGDFSGAHNSIAIKRASVVLNMADINTKIIENSEVIRKLKERQDQLKADQETSKKTVALLKNSRRSNKVRKDIVRVQDQLVHSRGTDYTKLQTELNSLRLKERTLLVYRGRLQPLVDEKPQSLSESRRQISADIASFPGPDDIANMESSITKNIQNRDKEIKEAANKVKSHEKQNKNLASDLASDESSLQGYDTEDKKTENEIIMKDKEYRKAKQDEQLKLKIYDSLSTLSDDPVIKSVQIEVIEGEIAKLEADKQKAQTKHDDKIGVLAGKMLLVGANVEGLQAETERLKNIFEANKKSRDAKIKELNVKLGITQTFDSGRSPEHIEHQPGFSTKENDHLIKEAQRRQRLYAAMEQDPSLIVRLNPLKMSNNQILHWSHGWVEKKPKPTFEGETLTASDYDNIFRMSEALSGPINADGVRQPNGGRSWNSVRRVEFKRLKEENEKTLREALEKKTQDTDAKRSSAENARDEGYLKVIKIAGDQGGREAVRELLKRMPGARDALRRKAVAMGPETDGLSDRKVETIDTIRTRKGDGSLEDDMSEYNDAKEKETAQKKKSADFLQLKALHQQGTPLSEQDVIIYDKLKKQFKFDPSAQQRESLEEDLKKKQAEFDKAEENLKNELINTGLADDTGKAFTVDQLEQNKNDRMLEFKQTHGDVDYQKASHDASQSLDLLEKLSLVIENIANVDDAGLDTDTDPVENEKNRGVLVREKNILVDNLKRRGVITEAQRNDILESVGDTTGEYKQKQKNIIEEASVVYDAERALGEMSIRKGDIKRTSHYMKKVALEGLDQKRDDVEDAKEILDEARKDVESILEGIEAEQTRALKSATENANTAARVVKRNQEQSMTKRQAKINSDKVYGNRAVKAAATAFGLNPGVPKSLGYDARMRASYAKLSGKQKDRSARAEQGDPDAIRDQKRAGALGAIAKARFRANLGVIRAKKRTSQEAAKRAGVWGKIKGGFGAFPNFIAGTNFGAKKRITVQLKSRSGVVDPIEYSNGLNKILSGENPCQTKHTLIRHDEVCVSVPIHLKLENTDMVTMGFKVVKCPAGTTRFPAKMVFHFEEYYEDVTQYGERWEEKHRPNIENLFCRGCDCLLGKGLRLDANSAGALAGALAGHSETQTQRRLYGQIAHNGTNVTIDGVVDSVNPGEFLRRMEFVVRSDSCQYEIANCENGTFSTTSTFFQSGYFSCPQKTCPDNTYIENINVTNQDPDCQNCPSGKYSNNPFNTSCVDQILCKRDEKFEYNGAEGSCTICVTGFQNRSEHRETTCYETFTCGPGQQIRLNGTTFDPMQLDAAKYHSLLQDASECFDSKQNCDNKTSQQETCLSMCTFGDFESCNLHETVYSLNDTSCTHHAGPLSCQKYHEKNYPDDYDSSSEVADRGQFCVDDGTRAIMLIDASDGQNYVCQGAEISEDSECRACYTACKNAREDTIIPRDHTLTCETCPDGTLKATAGRERCEAPTNCQPGEYANFTTTSVVCTKCPEGTHQPNPNVNASCIPCEWNLTMVDLACTCENSEEYLEDTSFCPVLSCQEGQYLSIGENVTVCAACDGYTYMPESDHNYTECFPMKTCLSGQQWGRPQDSVNDAECSLCPDGKFQPADNHSSACEDWTECPGENLYIQHGSRFNDALCDNTTCACNNGVGAECQDPRTQPSNCTSCNAGYFLSLTGGCDPCGFQEWSNGSAVQISETETGCFAKLECPEGEYDASDARQDSNCQPCNPCEPGNYAMGNCTNNVDTVCSECPAGQYQDFYDYTCNLCPVGQAQDSTGATSCDNCTVGRYQNESGQVGCKVCDSGTYQATPGSVECDNCTFGKYTNLVMSISCEECPIGTYSSSEGTVYCKMCGASDYQDETGKTSCKQCPSSDTYDAFSTVDRTTCYGHCQVGHHGPFICTACSENTYQSVHGYNGSACTACPEESASDPSSATCTKCKAGYGNTGSTDAFGHVICEVCSNSNDPPEFNDAVDGSACGQVVPCGPGFGYYPTPDAGINTNGTDDCSPCDVDMYSETLDFQQCQAQDTCFEEFGQDILYAGSSTQKRVCTPLDFCPDTQYVSERTTESPYTPSCKYIDICSTGEYESEAPIGSTDRWTANRVCSACPAGTYTDQLNLLTCTAWYVCGPDEYETVQPTNTSDRHCAPVKVCSANEYESTPPTDVSDRECEPLSTCALGTYINNSNYEGVTDRSIDRVCLVCTDGYTEQSNRLSCTPWRAVCDYANEYESKAPNALGNRECTPLVTCKSGEYESLSKTNTRDRTCLPLTQCVPGMRVSKLPNTTSDRVCLACTGGYYADQSNQLSCSPWPTCGTQLANVSRLTNHSDTSEGYCAPCADGTWAVTDTEDCQSWTTCGTQVDGSPRRVDHSATSSGVCTVACTSGWAVSTAENCQPWTECIVGKTFQVVSPNAARDRVCQNVTECIDGKTFQVVSPNAARDRACQNVTECIDGTEYESSPPNTTNNRMCHEYTNCNSGEYISVLATLVSDIECELWRQCAPGERETVQPNGTTNRECAPCTAGKFEVQHSCFECARGKFQNSTGAQSCHSCPEGFFGDGLGYTQCAPCADGKWSGTADAVGCQPWKTCGTQVDGSTRRVGHSATSPGACDAACTTGWTSNEVGDHDYGEYDCQSWTVCGTMYGSHVIEQFQYVSPTATRDRVCRNTRVCTSGSMYEFKAPSNVTDRACADVRTCYAGSYVSKEPTYTSNRECAICPTGKFTEGTNGLSCSNWTVCGVHLDGSARLTGATVTTRGTCEPCKSGWSQSVDADCQPWTVCDDDEYQSQAPSATYDRICRNVGKCLAGQFVTKEPVDENPRICGTCPANTYSSVNAQTCTMCKRGYGNTGTTDSEGHVVCETCSNANQKWNNEIDESACGDVQECGPGYGYDAQPSNEPDTTDNDCYPCGTGTYSNTTDYSLCKPWSTCELSVTYESQAPHWVEDRVCSPVSQCSAGQVVFGAVVGQTYETGVPSLLQDRECTTVQHCTLGQTYETGVPSLLQDRECTMVQHCTLGQTYETRAPSLIENRECRAVTSCGAKIELGAPTLLADTTCKTCAELTNIYAAECATTCSDTCTKIKQLYNTNCQTCSL